MAIQPKPMLLVCKECEWKGVYKPRSDVIMVSTNCPKCGSETNVKQATALDLLISERVKDKPFF